MGGALLICGALDEPQTNMRWRAECLVTVPTKERSRNPSMVKSPSRLQTSDGRFPLGMSEAHDSGQDSMKLGRY